MSDIPFRAFALPEFLADGDIIALYAGNTEPSHKATVSHVLIDGTRATVVTDAGRYDVPIDSQIWVVDWAPIAVLVPDL